MRVLVAEDEKELNRLITRRLEDEHYAVDSVYDGTSALDYLNSADYDIAVLDIMMPGLDGISVVKQYRQAGGAAPVLFLTARDSVSDRVTGLDSGADDYLVKPFSFQELLARLRALVRRKNENRKSTLEIADLCVDLYSRKVTRGAREIDLSSKEFAILEFLMMNEGRVLERESIRTHVWSWDYDGESNVVDVYIRFLRKKIDDGFEKKLIHTVRGAGYMIKDDEASPTPTQG